MNVPPPDSRPRRVRLAARRRRLGLSQEALAERLSVDRTTVARWESGATDPFPWVRAELAHTLHLSIDEVSDLLEQSTCGGQFGVVGNAPSNDLRVQLEAAEDRYDVAPAAHMLAEVTDLLAHVRRQRDADPGSREVAWLEAKAANLMGKVIWDASQRSDALAARDLFHRAIAASQRAGDSVEEASALLRICYVELYTSKDPLAAIGFAQKVTAVADRSSHVLAGLGLLHAAEGFAKLGDRREVERALVEAESRLAAASHDDPASTWLTPATFDRLAGSCYLSLGDGSRAQRILEVAEGLVDNGSKSQAIVTGNIALALIRQGLPDQAATVLDDTITIVSSNRGGGGLTVAFQAGRELQPWRTVVEVQNVREKLFTLIDTFR